MNIVRSPPHPTTRDGRVASSTRQAILPWNVMIQKREDDGVLRERDSIGGG